MSVESVVDDRPAMIGLVQVSSCGCGLPFILVVRIILTLKSRGTCDHNSGNTHFTLPVLRKTSSPVPYIGGGEDGLDFDRSLVFLRTGSRGVRFSSF